MVRPFAGGLHGWMAVILMAAAGGLGWGIRGQFGHETGAMIAGVLMGWVVAHCYLADANKLHLLRVVSLLAIGVSIGGSMTYGQTLGLTQNSELIGRWDALSWGMLGLAIKGGLWFAFAGLFLGIGLSGQRPAIGEVVVLFAIGLFAFPLGLWLFNSPFDRSGTPLPMLYFSESPAWYPEKTTLKARPECWGGLLLSLVAMTTYASWRLNNALAWRMAAWGGLAGGIGFPGGQCVQAYHAWNAEVFANSPWREWYQYVNWWNMMEMSFGAIAGGVLGVGLWVHRERIAGERSASGLSPAVELVLLATHIVLLLVSSFADLPALDWYQEYGLVLAFLPAVGVLQGRYWPYWFPTCIVLLPIAGKTIRHVGYEQAVMTEWQAWGFVALAMAAMIGLAVWGAWSPGGQSDRAVRLSAIGLAVSVMVYFVLNFGFFDFPWPWQAWTTRTPSALLMFAQSVILWLGCAWLSSASAAWRSSQ